MTSVPTGIAFELRWPRLDQGGLTYLEEYLQVHPNVRLVVVDTWARVSPKAQHRQRSQYEDEYAALTPLKYLADTYRVSILAIHHLRKMRGEDVLDEITGSIGLTGAVDGALILKRERGQHEASLFVTGRDIEHEQQLTLRFDAQTALWTLVGNAEEVRRTKERQDILDLLTEQFPEGMNPRQVAEALEKNYHTTRCLLRKLEAAGEIQHVNSQYVAIPGDNSRNQRNQSVPSALQRDDQIARGEESCPSASDDTDYAGESVSANGSQTFSIPPSFGGCSLQFPSASEDVLSPREDIQDAQDDRNVGVINRNQRNQSMSATRQAGDHVEQCSPTGSDYVDYAHESVSAKMSNVYGPSPPTGTSLQHLSALEDLLSQREDVQNAQDLRDDAAISVINRNQRNQLMLAATQAGDHIEQSSPKWTDYADYADYANESVSAYWTQTHEPDAPLSGGSLHLPAASEDLLSQSEDMQGTQDHRDDAVISVINRNQRNQSMSATTQVSDHVEQSSPNWTDYADYSDDIDYVDYADYANESVSAYWTQTHEPDPPPTGAALQYLPEARDLLTEREDIQGAQDHRVDYADGVINRNHHNQSDLPCSQATLRVEQSESDSALHANDASSGKARASPYAPGKKRCPHHPHARWIRFDPSGQAWCDHMDCWDCYRLMKIGEALDYRPLSKYTRGIVALEHGIDAWSSFVTSQGSFAVLSSTEHAIAFCKALGLEVPDLSGEAQRLVSAWE